MKVYLFYQLFNKLDPILYAYTDKKERAALFKKIRCGFYYKEKDRLLEEEYNSYRNSYKVDEIVVSQFIPDFYCNLQKDEHFNSEGVPLSVRASYLYLPTLKGKEYKAGILILDDVVCQLLNINRILFNRIDTSLKAPKLNARFYLNLLYVALSRFRDYITIMYPKDYKETITPILEE